MDKQEQIKNHYKFSCGILAMAQEEIKKLQLSCTHPNTHEGLYSWRVGCVDKAIICSDCGKMIKNLGVADLNEFIV